MKLKTILYPLSLALTMSACGVKNNSETNRAEHEYPLDTVLVTSRTEYPSGGLYYMTKIRYLDSHGNTVFNYHESSFKKQEYPSIEEYDEPGYKQIESVKPGDTVVISNCELIENLTAKRVETAWQESHKRSR